MVAAEVPHLGAHLAHGSNNPKDNKPVAIGEIPGVNKEVAKDNNNKVGVASNSNSSAKTIMVAVMAAARVVVTGTTKDNNKEEVTLAVRIGADFVKTSFINS